jgi:hypothetical protein
LVRLGRATSLIWDIMEINTTLEIKILRFITTYGAETLICWLDSFDKVVASKDYPLFRTLEREAVKSCGISIADLNIMYNNASTNAKRIIAFLAFHHLHIPVPSISKLLNVSARSVNYYIGEAEGWINQPKSNKTFTDSYNQVVEKLKIQ